jgi:hypothetical protein
MAEEQSDSLTETELASLAQKLKMLGNDLTPKEGRFLTEALQSGITMKRTGDVAGHTMQSALQGETMYYPSSQIQESRDGITMDQDVSSDIRVSVEVVGHFNAP